MSQQLSATEESTSIFLALLPGTTQPNPKKVQYIGSTLHPVTVTTRIITFSVGNSYRPYCYWVEGSSKQYIVHLEKQLHVKCKISISDLRSKLSNQKCLAYFLLEETPATPRFSPSPSHSHPGLPSARGSAAAEPKNPGHPKLKDVKRWKNPPENLAPIQKPMSRKFADVWYFFSLRFWQEMLSTFLNFYSVLASVLSHLSVIEAWESSTLHAGMQWHSLG